MEDNREQQKIPAERILEELAAVAFAKTSDYLSVDGGSLILRDWDSLSQQQMAAVASVENSSAGLKLKFYDKMKALEMLARLLGLFDGGAPRQEENNLLEAIVAAAGGEVELGDLPEAQQTAESGHDLVEPAGTEGV